MSRALFAIGSIVALIGFAIVALEWLSNSVDPVNFRVIGGIIIAIIGAIIAIYGVSRN